MVGTAGPWEVFFGTGMPEQQKYKLSTCVLESSGRYRIWGG